MDELKLISQLDTQRRKVDVEHFDITIREIVRMALDDELAIAPTYQRKFRWKTESESKLIESIYLGLPVPSLFFASNRDGTWEVVDGLQRISSLIHYVGDVAHLEKINKKTNLRLSGLEKLDSFEQTVFDELPQQIQLLFYKRSLRVTVLSDKSDYEARFDMFERLNTGGVSLTPQEVRTCIFRGQLTDFLAKMACYENFEKLVKLQSGKQHDGTKEELVLKFFAYLYEQEKFDGKVTTFLNNFSEKWAKGFNASKEEDLFVRSVDHVYHSINGPFLRANTSTTPLVQLEAVLVGVGSLIKDGSRVVEPQDPSWLNDEVLVINSTGGSNTKTRLTARVNRAREIFTGK